MKQKILSVLLTIAMLTLIGCSGSSSSTSTDTSVHTEVPAAAAMNLIGLAMNHEADGTGAAIQSALEAEGYSVEIAYAEDDTNAQQQQIAALLEDSASVLIVDSVDTAAVAEQLSSTDVTATDVIAYSSYVDSSSVHYYIGTDPYAQGQSVAQEVISHLALDETTSPVTLELLAGSSGSDLQCFNGMMASLNPYITARTVTIASGDTTFEACSSSSTQASLTKFTQTLASSYADQELNALLCTNADLSSGAVDTLFSSYTGSVFPTIVGIGNNVDAVSDLSQQYIYALTATPDTSTMETKVIQMVRDLTQTGTTETDSDSNLSVASVICPSTTITFENYEEILILPGLYVIDDKGSFSIPQ